MTKTCTPAEITVEGTVYVPKTAAVAEPLDGMPYVIIRTYSAGCFAGYLKSRDGKEVSLVQARRLWKWAGAMTLSELAVTGTSNPKGCNFAVPVDVLLTEAIEVLAVTEAGQASLLGVPEWK